MGRPAGRTLLRFACENCGVEVVRVKGQEREHTFCSRECYWKSDYRSQLVAQRNYERNPDAKQTRPCATCGVDVTRYVSTGQKRFYCSRQCRWDNYLHAKHKNAAGYVLVFVGRDYPGAAKSGHILEHRKVMQDVLGRPLFAQENVHHKNGVKDDNRPENLELWTRSQPHGQRVEDKLRWAREFLALYEGRADGPKE
jgi:endogenous inhibitor of DNA gyrase (YacG/DUF329 family)